MWYCILDGRGHLAAGWDAGEHVLVDACRGALLATRFVDRALLQQGREVARFEFECLVERVERFGLAAQGLEAARQVGPQDRMPRIGHRGAFKHRLRLFRRAAAEHAHTEFVQHRRMVGSVLGHACQQPVRFRHPPGGGFRARHLHGTGNCGLIERLWGRGSQGFVLGCVVATDPWNCTVSRPVLRTVILDTFKRSGFHGAGRCH